MTWSFRILGHFNSLMKTLEEIQKYIDDNNLSKSSLKRKHHNVYKLSIKLGILDKLKFPLVKTDLSKYKTEIDFQKYIDDNKVESLYELSKSHKPIYYKLVRNKLQSKVKFKKQAKQNLKEFNDLKSIQKFIDSNNINSPKELKESFINLFWKIHQLGINDKLIYKNKRNHRNLKSFSTLDSFQKFLDDNNILSAQEFHDIDYGLYQKAGRLKLLDKLKYKYKKRSKTEIVVEKELLKFYSYIEIEKEFDWLIYINNLSLDIYIPELKIAIECQGEHHFIPIDRFGGESGYFKQIERDKIKKNLCLEHGITLLYYSDFKFITRSLKSKIFSKINSYELGTVYTSLKDLINEIKRLEIEQNKKRGS